MVPEGKNELGLVQTLPWTNAMDQKWSVEIFGKLKLQSEAFFQLESNSNLQIMLKDRT